MNSVAKSIWFLSLCVFLVSGSGASSRDNVGLTEVGPPEEFEVFADITDADIRRSFVVGFSAVSFGQLEEMIENESGLKTRILSASFISEVFINIKFSQVLSDGRLLERACMFIKSGSHDSILIASSQCLNLYSIDELLPTNNSPIIHILDNEVSDNLNHRHPNPNPYDGALIPFLLRDSRQFLQYVRFEDFEEMNDSLIPIDNKDLRKFLDTIPLSRRNLR